MNRRPTKRALEVALVGIVLVLAGFTAQAGWLYVVAAGVLGIVASSFLYRHHLDSVDIRRSVPSRARLGDDVPVRISVTNLGRRSVPPSRIEDQFRPFFGTAVACDRLAPDGRGEIEVVRRPSRRGVFDAGQVTMTCGAPFGFLRSRRTIDVRSRMTVIPRWVDLTSFPILEPSSFPADVLHERARVGAGEEFLGVREYRPGDSPRAVHWRSTARAGRLMVREYEEHPSTQVAIVLAGADHGVPPRSAFEALVSAAASVALYALATGHPVDLVRAERSGGLAWLHEPERDDALDWFAAAEAADVSPMDACRHALGRLGRRGTVVLCAPTAGVAGAAIDEAARTVQAAGARGVVIAAQSSTWDPSVEDANLDHVGGGRGRVRVLRRGESLRSCLQA